VRANRRSSTVLAGYSLGCHVSLRRNELNEENTFPTHLYLTSVSIRTVFLNRRAAAPIITGPREVLLEVVILVF
jgi:hypothetical protein